MNNVVIVTGAAGFIGSFLCEKLINEGYYVIGADNLFRGKVSNLNNIIKDKKFKFMNIDLNDSYKVNNFLKPYKKIKFFFHLAAINGTEHFYDKSSYVFNNNVNILYNTLDSIKINKTLIEITG